MLEVTKEDLQLVRRRHQELMDERQREEPVLKEIRNYCLPYRGLFSGEKADKDGSRKDQDILNGVAVKSIRVLAAGMQSGVTSPARPWFKLMASDPDFADIEAVRAFFDECERRMMAVFSRSNLYNSLHALYLELAGFATGAVLVEEDFDTTIRCRTFTSGEYALGIGADLRVNRVARLVEFTAGQLLEDFETDVLPEEILKEAKEDKNYRKIYKVAHLVEQNPNFSEADSLEGRVPAKYRSIYWLEGKTNEKPLRVEGYSEMPIITPRWDLVANMVYGRGPAWECLGEVKQLQRLERDFMGGLAKQVNPPVNVPDTRVKPNTMPGGVNYYSATGAEGRPIITPLYAVNFDLSGLRETIHGKEQSVREYFYADLFQMLSSYAGPQMTAQEVIERHEEKMIMLGPVLERLHSELLTPLIERTFAIMGRMNQLPDPPEELEGEDVKVEYVSILAQAQKMANVKGFNEMVQFVGTIANLKPESVQQMDEAEMIDRYAEALGIPPGCVIGRDELMAIRQAAQEEQEKMKQLADVQAGLNMTGQAAGVAKDLSQAQMSDPSALAAILGQGEGGMM